MKISSASTRFAVTVGAEFELRVGDDDSLRQRMIGGLHIDLQRAVAKLVGAHPAHHFDHLGERDVLIVVAQCGFRRRSEQWRGELAGLHQARRQRNPADLACRLVVEQSRPGQVPASHALHRKHLQLPHHQRAAQHLIGDAGIVRWPGQVVRGVDEAEEEHAHRGQDAALVWDDAVEDVVVRGDAVGGDQQQMFVIDAVQLADLAAGQMLVVGQCGTHRASLSGAARAAGELCWDRGYDIAVLALCDHTRPAAGPAVQRCRRRGVDGDMAAGRRGRLRRHLGDRRGRAASRERSPWHRRQPGLGGPWSAAHSVGRRCGQQAPYLGQRRGPGPSRTPSTSWTPRRVGWRCC